MPVTFTRGDIFDSGAHVLVNPVNCVGVMGKGLAAQFKRRFPENFDFYARRCKSGQLRPGDCAWFALTSSKTPEYICNMATKGHWKNASKFDDVSKGIQTLAGLSFFRSIAIPPVGCGLGGLNWRYVRPLIEKAFASHPAQVIVYEP